MRAQTNKQMLLHLSLIPGVGPATIQRLLRKFLDRSASVHSYSINAQGVELCGLYSFSLEDLKKEEGRSNLFATRVYHGLRDTRSFEQEQELLARHVDISYVSLLEDEYPFSLRSLFVPPVILYMQGTPLAAHDTQALAVVGSRDAGTYARDVVAHIVTPIARAGWTIVSGGAIGVDAMAHKVALSEGGKTVAVLGSGLLEWYPAANKGLFADIVRARGTLVSSYPLTEAPLAKNFPARNRIIAGLARGCLLASAGLKSGSRITAEYALEQGKSVFAAPGSIFDPLSEGCHALIAQGARLVSSAQDVFDEFGITGEHMPRQTSIILEENSKVQRAPSPSVAEQSSPQAQLLNALNAPISLDELCLKTGGDSRVLSMQLFELQLDGVVVQNYAGLWLKA